MKKGGFWLEQGCVDTRYIAPSKDKQNQLHVFTTKKFTLQIRHEADANTEKYGNYTELLVELTWMKLNRSMGK